MLAPLLRRSLAAARVARCCMGCLAGLPPSIKLRFCIIHRLRLTKRWSCFKPLAFLQICGSSMEDVVVVRVTHYFANKQSRHWLESAWKFNPAVKERRDNSKCWQAMQKHSHSGRFGQCCRWHSLPRRLGCLPLTYFSAKILTCCRQLTSPAYVIIRYKITMTTVCIYDQNEI